jgi:hypothetical protein
MISLLAPWGLAALAVAGVPIALHWIRRSDRQVRSFAAMRYLREHPHPREKFRLHERLLLLVRLLLIGSVALLLSLPVWRSRSQPQAPWIVVAPGIDAAAARANVAQPGAEWHRLAPGFPALDAPARDASARDASALDAPQSEAPASLPSLVRELDAELAPGTAMTLVVPAELGGLDAERLRLARPVAWRVLPGTSPQAAPPAMSTPAAPGPPAAFTVAARYDPADTTELPMVRALAAAWQADGIAFQLDIAPRAAPLPPTPAWLFWLGAPAPPGLDAWVRGGNSVLLTRRADAPGTGDAAHDVDGARMLGAGRALSLAGPLRADAMLALASPDFPRRLAELLRGPPLAPDRAPAASVAPLTLPSALPALGPPQPLSPYFAVAIALLFLLERVVATRTRTSNSVASTATGAGG